MPWYEFVIKAGAVLTGLGIIFGIVSKFVKATENLKETIADLEEHSSDNYMNILRLTIFSADMPIGERIGAGIKYLKAGGNGDTKKFLKETFNIDETTETATHYKK
jgi:hypothetical protein